MLLSKICKDFISALYYLVLYIDCHCLSTGLLPIGVPHQTCSVAVQWQRPVPPVVLSASGPRCPFVLALRIKKLQPGDGKDGSWRVQGNIGGVNLTLDWDQTENIWRTAYQTATRPFTPRACRRPRSGTATSRISEWHRCATSAKIMRTTPALRASALPSGARVSLSNTSEEQTNFMIFQNIKFNLVIKKLAHEIRRVTSNALPNYVSNNVKSSRRIYTSNDRVRGFNWNSLCDTSLRVTHSSSRDAATK